MLECDAGDLEVGIGHRRAGPAEEILDLAAAPRAGRVEGEDRNPLEQRVHLGQVDSRFFGFVRAVGQLADGDRCDVERDARRDLAPHIEPAAQNGNAVIGVEDVAHSAISRSAAASRSA